MGAQSREGDGPPRLCPWQDSVSFPGSQKFTFMAPHRRPSLPCSALLQLPSSLVLLSKALWSVNSHTVPQIHLGQVVPQREQPFPYPLPTLVAFKIPPDSAQIIPPFRSFPGLS